MTFALGEAAAHLRHLVRRGRLRCERREGEPDRFTRA
jgi:hypothetical protein